MARLDVHTRRDGGAGYLLDVQADILSSLQTRLVIPLLPLERAPSPASRLNPIFDLPTGRHAMVTQFAAAIHVRDLGECIASLDEVRDVVIAALDMLITGV